MPYIISGEVKSKDPVVVYAVILKEHEIGSILIQADTRRSSIGGSCAGAGVL